MGSRRSPLSKGLVTAARCASPPNDDELEDVSDIEEAPLWSPGIHRGGTGAPPTFPPPPKTGCSSTPGWQGRSPPGALATSTPCHQQRTNATPLMDVEDCTPASKRPRVSASGGTPTTRWRSRAQSHSPQMQGPLCGIRQMLFTDGFSPSSQRGTEASDDDDWLVPPHRTQRPRSRATQRVHATAHQ